MSYTNESGKIAQQNRQDMHDAYMKRVEREAMLNKMLPRERVEFLREEAKANENWAAEYREKAAFEKEKAKMEARGYKLNGSGSWVLK